MNKYKCWDKKNNWMWRVTEIAWDNSEKIIHIRGNTNYYGIKDAPIGGHRAYIDIDKFLILLQYTGFTDKNGIENYHKDVCAYKDGTGALQQGIIEWESGAWWLKAIGGDDEGNQDLILWEAEDIINLGSSFLHPEIWR